MQITRKYTRLSATKANAKRLKAFGGMYVDAMSDVLCA